MLAQVLYIDNVEEIEIAEANAEKLNLPNAPVPEEKYSWYEYHFNVESVHIACINEEGNINIFLPSGKWILKYNKALWSKITEFLDQK